MRSLVRNGHGAGKGVPRVEGAIRGELSAPVPTAEAVPTVPLNFRRDGKIGDSATARVLGKKGGQKNAGKLRLVDSLGLSSVVAETSFGPYREAAEAFAKAHVSELARQAGGEVGPGPSTMVSSAALQLAASRWAFDKGAEANDPALFKLGSALANDSRQNLLAAYELAVREAQARRDAPGALRPGWHLVDGANAPKGGTP